MQWNCRGYSSNYEELKVLIKNKLPDCICLQETFHGIAVQFTPRGYTASWAPQVNIPPANTRPSRGVVTLIRNSIPSYAVNLNTNLEATANRIKLSREVTICNIYISPGENITRTALVGLLNQLPPPYIVLGDFNARHTLWGDSIINRHGGILEDMLLNTDVSLLNDGSATHFHVQTGTWSCIDLSICSPELLVDMDWSVMDDSCGSDHYPILIRESRQTATPNESKFNINRADWKLFKSLTIVTEEEYLNNDDSIDDLVEQFNALIYSAAEHSIPKTTPNSKHCPVPWWNRECQRTHDERKRARNRYQRTRAIPDKIALNRASAVARKTKREARRQSWREYVTKINENTPMSKVWKRIRKIKGKNSTGTPCLRINGDIEMDAQKVADHLAQHLSSVSSHEAFPPEFQTIKRNAEISEINFHTLDAKEYNCEITMDEVESALKTTTNTAPGGDNIHYAMLKHLSQPAFVFLLYIFNRVFTTKIPDIWNRAVVLPFPKPNKDPLCAGSYRPIALTSCVCKLIEKILNHRLVHYLEKSKFFNPAQYGFRKKRSTMDSLVKLETDILDAFANQEQLVAVFFDIEKAYDTAWRHHILKCLHDAGIRGKLGNFIRNFLSGRTFQVQSRATRSVEKDQKEGVPQGSVLSVTLFAVAINNITSKIPGDVSRLLYVDDLAIYYASRNIRTIERKLQLSINAITNWTERHGFRFSSSKTVAVQFHRKRGLQHEPTISLYNQPITFKTSTKFLGLIFDQRLRWSEQVLSVTRRCLQSLNLLRCLTHLRWGADRTQMLRLYRSLIRSKMDYGCHIYASAPKRILKKIDSVHHAAIRICTGAFRSSPIPSLLSDAGECTLDQRRQQLGLQHYIRIQQLPDSPTYTTIMNDEMVLRYRNNPKLTRPFSIRIRDIMNDLDLQEMRVLPHEPPPEPPWKLPNNFICQTSYMGRKKDLNPHRARLLFLDHCEHYHSDSLPIYTDGSRTANGVGCSAVSAHFTIETKLPDQSSIFSAELFAILTSLREIERLNYRIFTIFTDSRSAVQLLQSTRCDHAIGTKIQSWIVRLATRRKLVSLCWVPSHLQIAGNERADELAGRAATAAVDPDYTDLPYSDYYSHIKTRLHQRRQMKWTEIPDTNKLRRIKDTADVWPSSNNKSRLISVILTRLRIGHTRLTHGHLMEARPLPYCDNCLVPLTVEHILVECPEYINQRYFCFPTNQPLTLKLILSEPPQGLFNADRLMEYLSLTGLIDRL